MNVAVRSAPRARPAPPQHWSVAVRDEPPASRRPKVTAVIPAKDEAANIGLVLRALPEIVDEVVVVDGHSTDGTCEVARAVRPDVTVIQQPGRGKGDALRAGFAASNGDYVVMLDADGSMNPAEIRRVVMLLDEGFEFVKGSRFVTGGGSADITTIRRLGATGLLWLTNMLFGTRHTDLLYGYCGFRRSSLPKLGLSSDGFEIETEIVTRAARCNLLTAEMPSFEAERLSGSSHLSAVRDGLRVLRMILRERFLQPALRTAPVDDRRGVTNPGRVASNAASEPEEAG